MKTVGIIGGLGPETTSEFYMNIIRKNEKISKTRPKILIHNVPIPMDLEEDIVKNSRNEKGLLPLLIQGLEALQDKVDFIVIPCNTAHIFIEDVVKKSKIPVISIIEETINDVKVRNIKKVGLLATSKTIEKKLFEIKLSSQNIQQLQPTNEEQKRISSIINELLQGTKSNDSKKFLLSTIHKLKQQGAEAIILGCTDLQLLLKQTDSPLLLIDTMNVLTNSTVRLLHQSEAEDK